jgi:GntR family transcriptional regulator, gluconate operon transcriptional repressor
MLISDIDPAEQPKLWEHVLDTLRLQIFSGKIPPGTQLVESELADLFGVSRGPIREALIYLEQERLVIREPRRGAFVRGVTEDDVREIYGLRLVLEVYGAELSCSRLEPEHLDRMQDCIRHMVELRRESNWKQSAEADLEFHRIPLIASGHRRLVQSWDMLRGSLVALTATTAPHYPDLLSATHGLHQELLDAYFCRDVDAVRRILSEHVSATESVMFNVLRMGNHSGSKD